MHVSVVCVLRERDLVPLRERLAALPRHAITVVATADTTDGILHVVREHRADVLLLDPALDDGLLLDRWSEEMGTTPVLICYSASEVYAVPAFHAGAVHYLTPDTLRDGLAVAIDRAVARLVRYDREGGNGNAAHETRAPFHCRVIALPATDGIEVRTSEQLLSAHGEGGYTRVLLQDEAPMLLARSLGEVEPALRDAGMVRVHRSHMINPECVRRIRRGKTAIVELVNGLEVDVSERYRGTLFDMLQIRIGRKQDLG